MTTFNSTDEPILFPKNSHPMLSFIKGDTKDKFNIITNHPQDEGVTFVENEDIKISYLPKVILEVDVKENSKQSVGYVTDELDDYNIVTVKKRNHTTDTHYFTGGILLPDTWKNDNTIIINLPIVLPKIIGFLIIKSLIDDEVVVNSMITYYPISQELLAVISENCQVNYQSKIDNTDLLLQNFTTIVTEDIDLDVNILTRSNNLNNTYTAIKSKVVKFKRTCYTNVSLTAKMQTLELI